MPKAPAARSRLARFFFMHLGSLVAVVVYFTLANRAEWTADGTRSALWAALGVKTAYAAIAWLAGEFKHFDLSLWLFFAIGALGMTFDVAPVPFLYRTYSPALVFATLGLAATVPLLFGWEPFTLYYARRQTPRWQQKTATFATIARLLSAYWGLLFFLAAALCVARPADPMFTVVYPNLLVLGGGLPATAWFPPLYMRLARPPLPDTAEALIMGMPFIFDRRAAGDALATIQFRVSGAQPGDYYLRIAAGRCESAEGVAASPDLTVHTPDTVWVHVARGEVDGRHALAEGLYHADGDVVLLAKLREWFPSRASAAEQV